MDDDAVTGPLAVILGGLLFAGGLAAVVLATNHQPPTRLLDNPLNPGHEHTAHALFDSFVRPFGATTWTGTGWNDASASATNIGLSLSPGVLDSHKLAKLSNAPANAGDGLLEYSEVRGLFGLQSWQGFRLLVTSTDGATVWTDFGEPAPPGMPSAPNAATFCLDTCDTTAGGQIALVRLFVFDGASGATPSAPTLPDLAVASIVASPASPLQGQSTIFTATVTNLGVGTLGAVPIPVRFNVDGVLLGTTQVMGPLAPGASVAVASPAWTAGSRGAHTVDATADPSGAIAESNEANNAGSLAFTVISPTDPGQAFIDTNNNGLYDPPADTLISTAVIPGTCTQLSACTFNAGAQGLVIPSSVGAITAKSFSFTASKNLFVGVSLTASTTVLLKGADITVAGGTTLSSQGSLTLDQTSTAVASGATLKSAGAISIGGLTPPGQLGSSIALVGSTVDNTAGSNGITLNCEGGSLDATNAKITSKGAIAIGGANNGHKANSVVLSGATLDNTLGSNSISVQYVSGAVTASGALTKILAKGAITLAAGTALDVTSATIDNTAGSNAIALSGATVTASSATVKGKGQIDITSTGTLTAAALTVDNSSGSNALTLSASGAMDASSSKLTSKGALTVSATGALTATGATWDNSLGSTSFTVSSGAAADLGSTGVAKLTSKGAMSVTAATGLTLTGATVSNSGGSNPLALTAGTSLACNGCALTSGTTMTLKGASIALGNAAQAMSGSSLSATTSAGALSANGLKATSNGDQTWSTTGGSIDFTNAKLTATGKNLAANVPSTKSGGSYIYSIAIGGATFVDANNKLDVTPNGDTTGTPASGGTE